MKALISIHDVMPETFGNVLKLIQWLKERGIPPCTLLIVPGKNWQADQIEQLREFLNQGYSLAAHGWLHKTKPKRFFHKLHAFILSRDVAEHLDLNSHAIINLMKRSHKWFLDNNLGSPSLYVPPAWALGFVKHSDLKDTPFKQVETTRGVIALEKDKAPKLKCLPVSGYEADTMLRKTFLNLWNQLQENHARFHNDPLRISIHPNDLELKIADQLNAQVRRMNTYLKYEDI